MRRTPILCVLVAASLASAAVVGPGLAGTPKPKASATVTAKIAGFGPAKVTVRPGARLTFRNTDGEDHNAVSTKRLAGKSAFTSGAPTDGDFRAKAPRTKGTYRYICQVHPLTMKGTIVVK